ncbi:MAG TPA: hypothetical protein VMF90_12375 [Rhizobiaceae bacterium]|nr:hypothetical protein [Rhizobiaceae bacterium]
MTDISITAANVQRSSSSDVEVGTAAATITAGQCVYRVAATGRFNLSDSNSGTAEAREVFGIALNGASAGQPLSVQRSGDITIGGTLTAGVAYYLSDTPGGICPVSDVGSGEYSVVLGVAKSASVLALNIQASGVAL